MQEIKFRIFRTSSVFIISKQKVATRFLGSAFENEGHEISLDNKLKITHIDLLGGDDSDEDIIKKEWKEILAGTYPGEVLFLIRNPIKRFASAQTQDFSDVLTNVNENYLVQFAFTSYWNRRFKKSTTFLSKLFNHVEEGKFDKIVMNSDNTYDIDAYNLFKDLFYDWIVFRHDTATLNTLHSENYLFSLPMILTKIEGKTKYQILNIDDPTASLKNALKPWIDVDIIDEGQRVEGKELKSIFSDLLKENVEVKKIMNNSLQGEIFVYDNLKNHKNTIKGNITL